MVTCVRGDAAVESWGSPRRVLCRLKLGLGLLQPAPGAQELERKTWREVNSCSGLASFSRPTRAFQCEMCKEPGDEASSGLPGAQPWAVVKFRSRSRGS